MKTDDMELDLTIVTPVYNTPVKFLDDYLESVLKIQGITYEAIMVSDGSTDKDTLEWLKRVDKEHETIRVILREENCGISVCRNIAIKTGRGRYILTVDSDDMTIASELPPLVRYADKTKADLMIAGFKTVGISNREFTVDRTRPLVSAMRIQTGGWLIRRGFLIENDVLYPEGKYLEDVTFILGNITKAGKISYSRRILGINRTHEASTSHQSVYQHMREDQIPFKELERFLSDFDGTSCRYAPDIYGFAVQILAGIACLFSAHSTPYEKERISGKAADLMRRYVKHRKLNALLYIIKGSGNLLADVLPFVYAVALDLRCEKLLEKTVGRMLK
ncbi:MAG: glycosyltransferase family 2 protein [Lachnospiraceae bacterium]|nr:glycosyltransferase family 2 protein [Lachnospiraceae bacterium]